MQLKQNRTDTQYCNSVRKKKQEKKESQDTEHTISVRDILQNHYSLQNYRKKKMTCFVMWQRHDMSLASTAPRNFVFYAHFKMAAIYIFYFLSA